MMKQDIRETHLYREAEALYRSLQQPGSGQISDAAEVHVSPDGRSALFAGTIVDVLEGTPPTRICKVDLATGDTRILTFGPNLDRLPKWSPDGRLVAFLSDREKSGNFQLYLLDPTTGAARSTPRLAEGWVEYLHWSPDGKRILLGVAGHGADISGGQGAVASGRIPEDLPSWMPAVEIGDERYRWRRAWVYDLISNSVHQISQTTQNVWEAAWCGNQAVAAVVSRGPSEGLWYSANLERLDLQSGASHQIYKPDFQIGWPAASPSGKQVAIVEAVCSDRGFVAGDLRLIDTCTGEVQRVNTKGVDVTYTEWRSDRHLLLAGHRGLSTVIGSYDVTSATFNEVWANCNVTTGGTYVSVSGCNDTGDCVLVGEGFTRAPELAVIRDGRYQSVRSFDLGCADLRVLDAAEQISWTAPDGLEIQGWLLHPHCRAPYPLIMHVHGGPVWHWRSTWLGRRAVPALMLLKRGYAVFYPNPRGSSGRGQEFVRRVVGDLGGADTLDYLSGLDHLIERKIADPNRLAVMGGSYGGFMTAWLVTQDTRFSAAIATAPVTNHVTEHLISNIPHFVSMFLGDTYTSANGRYFERSPIMHAHKVTTPTMNVCGAKDRCTPPEEAVQFHNALLENGVKSVLLTYPEEGHGIRKRPAVIDYTARVVGWLEEHCAARRAD